jgi:hypothetical protein
VAPPSALCYLTSFAVCFARHDMAHRRRKGTVNYKNDVLIKIVGEMLLNGEYGWQAVANAYQVTAKEETVCDTTDLKKHWMRNLCNNMKKPTGQTGEIFKHPIYRTAAHSRGESKNHAQMFIQHRAPQKEKKQSNIPCWAQRRRPSATTMSRPVLQVKEIIHKHRKCTLAQSSEVKKGRQIGSFVEILSPGFQRWKNCQPEEVMAVLNIIMILQQQYNQHNPSKTRSTVIAIEECKEHHGIWLPFWMSLCCLFGCHHVALLLAGRGNGNN